MICHNDEIFLRVRDTLETDFAGLLANGKTDITETRQAATKEKKFGKKLFFIKFVYGN